MVKKQKLQKQSKIKLNSAFNEIEEFRNNMNLKRQEGKTLTKREKLAEKYIDKLMKKGMNPTLVKFPL